MINSIILFQATLNFELNLILHILQADDNKNGNAIQDLRRQRLNEILKNDLIIWQPPP